MKKLFIPILVLFISLGITLNAQDKQSTAKKGSKAATAVNTTGSDKPFNTVCPVSGEDLDSDAKTFSYNGKTYGVCCNKCLAKIKKDPEKYTSRLSEDGKSIKKAKPQTKS